MILDVKAHPRARLNKVEQRAETAYTVWTTAPPDKGAANAAIAKLLATHLGVAPGRVVLRKGATSRQKLFEVVG